MAGTTPVASATVPSCYVDAMLDGRGRGASRPGGPTRDDDGRQRPADLRVSDHGWRLTGDTGCRRDVMGHHGAGRHEGAFADVHAEQHGRGGSDPHVLVGPDRLRWAGEPGGLTFGRRMLPGSPARDGRTGPRDPRRTSAVTVHRPPAVAAVGHEHLRRCPPAPLGTPVRRLQDRRGAVECFVLPSGSRSRLCHRSCSVNGRCSRRWLPRYGRSLETGAKRSKGPAP